LGLRDFDFSCITGSLKSISKNKRHIKKQNEKLSKTAQQYHRRDAKKWLFQHNNNA
jgi:hypothetical protein